MKDGGKWKLTVVILARVGKTVFHVHSPMRVWKLVVSFNQNRGCQTWKTEFTLRSLAWRLTVKSFSVVSNIIIAQHEACTPARASFFAREIMAFRVGPVIFLHISLLSLPHCYAKVKRLEKCVWNLYKNRFLNRNRLLSFYHFHCCHTIIIFLNFLAHEFLSLPRRFCSGAEYINKCLSNCAWKYRRCLI